jgi:hypothetical protein
MASEISVIDVDLSKQSHGSAPTDFEIQLKVLGGVVTWLLLLSLLIAIRAYDLAIELGIASVVAVAIVFIVISAQRTRKSIFGRPVSAIRPEHEHDRLPQFDRSLGEIANMVEAAAKEDAPALPIAEVARHAGPRGKSILYIILGVTLFVCGMTILFAIGAGGALLAVAMCLLIWGMLALFTRGRRVLQPSASMAVANDPRPPILFLRSFRDDRTAAPVRVKFAGFRWWGGIRLEEALGQTVGKLGPFLAVGEPNEGLPQLGAARAYLGQDAWQKAVLGWIRTSRLIIMLAGPTSWIHWEMQNVVQFARLHRLLLVLPPGRTTASQKLAAARQQRWDNIVRSLAETPFGEALKQIDISNVLMVQFRPGRLLVFRSRSNLIQEYDLALTLAIYGTLSDQYDEPIAQPPSAVPLPEPSPSPPPRASARMAIAQTSQNAAAAWFGVLGFAGGLVLAFFGDESNMRLAGPRALITAFVTATAVAIGVKLVLRCSAIEAGIFFALAGGIILVGEFVFQIANDLWFWDNPFLILLIKVLEPVLVMAGGWYIYSLFRDRGVWMIMLGANALAMILVIFLLNTRSFPPFSFPYLFVLYALPATAFVASIGYALARESQMTSHR